jgi:hypothetical protein
LGVSIVNNVISVENISKIKDCIQYYVDDFDAVISDLYQRRRITDGQEKCNSPVADVSSLNSADYDASTGQIT